MTLTELKRACETDNPYLATTVLYPSPDGAASILSLRDTTAGDLVPPLGNPSAMALAGTLETGQLYGLAFDHVRGVLYSAKLHLNRSQLGHTNTGSIYHTDLQTGNTVVALEVDAGVDPRPNRRFGQDYSKDFIHSIGRIGLGDIDIDEEARWLFAVNLAERVIHRFGLPDLTEQARISLPEHLTDDSDEVLPFGLGLWGDLLYAGAIVLGKGLPQVALLSGPAGGSSLELVLLQTLDYPRSNPWASWSDDSPFWPDGSRKPVRAEPMVADIEFAASGFPIVGLGNRMRLISAADGVDGNVLPTRMDPSGAWVLLLDPDFYDDHHFDTSDGNVELDVSDGALARLPGQNLVAAVTSPRSGYGSVRWLNNDSGRMDGPVDGAEGLVGDVIGLGDLEVLCAPRRAEPSATPTATATASPTDLPPTSTPLATDTASPSRTPRPAPLYLPLLQRSHCVPEVRNLEVSLVLDLSTSMLRPSEGGGRKLDGLMAAVQAFVDVILDESTGATGREGGARVGLVGFHHQAFELAGLSGDPVAARAALAELPGRLAEGTRLDLAIAAGTQQLVGQGRPDAQRVLILITDGLPNQVPTPAPTGSQEDTVLRQAQAARAAGHLIYTVGLGRPDAPDPLDRINAQLLQSIAADPGRYHQTPAADLLAGIYRQVAADLRGCPGG